MGVAAKKATKVADQRAARAEKAPAGTYTVLCDEFRTRGEVHLKGATVELSPADAKQALEVGAIAPTEEA
jgi:hypothetical protein